MGDEKLTMTDKLSHKERTRARILDEAAQAMRQHGFEGIGVASLMKRAGLTHGGFYAHFNNRDDLVAHAVDRMFQDNQLMLARHLDRDDIGAGLSALVDDYLSERRLAVSGRGCPFPPLLGEAARMPPVARTRFAQGVEMFRVRLRDALDTLGRKDADALASSLLSELIGAATEARAFGEGEAAASMLRAARSQIKSRLGLPD